MEVYTIYDKIAGVYGHPCCFANQAVAVRQMASYCLDKNSYLAKDCDIYFLGKFDEFTGTFELKDKPEFILNIGEFVNAQ